MISRKKKKGKTFRYQIQMSTRVAQLLDTSAAGKGWHIHGDNIFKNIASFKKAKKVFAQMPIGAKLVDKKKKIYWIKGATA